MAELDFGYLSLGAIDISISNVRKVNLEEDLDSLAESIKEIGVQQPVVVFKTPNDRYELIIGQRRYLACKKIGLEKIPAIITSVKNETDAIIKSFSENIHRLDLDYQDKMWVASELLKRLQSIEKVAKTLGVSQQTVKNYLGYSAVPEQIKKMVTERKLSTGTAIRIAKNITDEKKAIRVAEKIEEIPRNEDKIEFIDVAKEHPYKELKEVREIAEKRRKRKITLDLTERISEALYQACEKYSSDEKQIALEALEQWLADRGFINE